MQKIFNTFLFYFSVSCAQRRFNTIVKMINATADTNLPFSLLAKRLSNYGCYCFSKVDPDEIVRGAPLDEKDAFCKEHAECNFCNVCTDSELDGRYMYNIVHAATGVEIDCSRNPDPCNRQQCECDREFAYKFASIWSDEAFDFTNWFNRKNIYQRRKQGIGMAGYKDRCEKSSENHEVPALKSLVSQSGVGGGSKECCARQLFNSAHSECCDGKVVSIGQC